MYIGEYYLLSEKKSEYSYKPSTVVEAFALTKTFMFDVIYEKYPSLLQDMLGEAHARYNKLFKRPMTKLRDEQLERINKQKPYTVIKVEDRGRLIEMNNRKDSKLEKNKDLKEELL